MEAREVPLYTDGQKQPLPCYLSGGETVAGPSICIIWNNPATHRQAVGRRGESRVFTLTGCVGASILLGCVFTRVLFQVGEGSTHSLFRSQLFLSSIDLGLGVTSYHLFGCDYSVLVLFVLQYYKDQHRCFQRRGTTPRKK